MAERSRCCTCCSGLAGHGVANTLVCPPGSAIGSAVNAAEVRVSPLPMAGDLDALFAMRLTALLAADPPDLVHVHSRRGADIWGGLAARRAGVPAVLSRRVDNPDPPLLGPLRYRLYDRVIAISGAHRCACSARVASLRPNCARC